MVGTPAFGVLSPPYIPLSRGMTSQSLGPHGHKRHSIRRQTCLFENILQVLSVSLGDTLKLTAFGKFSTRINASCLKQPIVDDVAPDVCCDKRVRYQVCKGVDDIQHGDLGIPRDCNCRLQSELGIENRKAA